MTSPKVNLKDYSVYFACDIKAITMYRLILNQIVKDVEICEMYTYITYQDIFPFKIQNCLCRKIVTELSRDTNIIKSSLTILS